MDPNKGYIQVTFVQPYCGDDTSRLTPLERSVNVNVFVYDTPFIEGGGARGRVEDQKLRKTYLRTEQHFPYVKSRLLVVEVRRRMMRVLFLSLKLAFCKEGCSCRFPASNGRKF